jgi:hypothetical protein
MNELPNEMIITILSFLSVYDLHVISKDLLHVYQSNVVWKPIVTRKFGEIKSTNYFKEYGWQLKLKKHQFCYQRQWTLGCVGRIRPPAKEDWTPAIF